MTHSTEFDPVTLTILMWVIEFGVWVLIRVVRRIWKRRRRNWA